MFSLERIYILCMIALCALSSCKDNDSQLQGEPVLQLQRSIGFKKEGGETSVQVKSNRDWTASVTVGGEWLSAQKASATELVVRTKENKQQGRREGTIQVENEGSPAVKLKVVQTGTDPVIEVVSEHRIIHVSYAGEEALDINLLSNIDYDVVISEDTQSWISEKEVPETRSELASSKRIFSIATNHTSADREAVIKFVSKENAEVYDEARIKQKKESSDVSGVNIPKDKLLKVTGGSDTDHQSGQDVSKSFDGIRGGAPYHSTWGQKAKFPVSLEYEFAGNTMTVDYIVYHSRNGNGNLGEFELYIKPQPDGTSASEYVKIGDYDFRKAGGSHRILLDGSMVPADVKFIVKSGAGDFVSCDEMEFFHREGNPLDGKLKAAFTDLSCSEINPEATAEDISQLPDFFKILAKSLQDNAYPEEEKRFRIQSYKAYSSPEYWADKLRTYCYSPLCNPTGIITNVGEEMIILADGLNNESVSIRCCPDEGPGGEDVLLQNGINKISFSKAGNLFVIYQKVDPRNAPQIKIHFPPQSAGQVEHARVGFNVWDLAVDQTDDKYREYLRKAKTVKQGTSESCIFVLKGAKSMFTARKDLLQNQDNFKGYGVLKGIQRWDDLLRWEQELCAIDTYANTGEFNSLMHITTFKDGLFATNYYINMAGGDVNAKDGWGFKNNFDPRDMDKNQDNQWGPGHELGHMHQGAINWPSTMESSNNLFSNYVVYKIDRWGSRGSSIEQLSKFRHAPATAWARFNHRRKAGSTTEFDPHDMGDGDDNVSGLYQGEASEMHMRLNQQLWTYFERIGKKPGTIRKIFEQGRTSEFWLPYGEPGKAQMLYARSVAKAANMDMTEFFDVWGFFIPVKKFNFRGYGDRAYEVTQQMIDETRAYMRTFKTKCPPIQYIEDRKFRAGATGNQKGVSEDGGDVGYFDTFRNNVKITKAVSYSVSGRTYTVTNGDQAVAFELKKEGKVIWFANRFTFTVPADVNVSDSELYAVQCDGQRIKMTKR